MFEQTILILVLALNFVLIWIGIFKQKFNYNVWGAIIWIVLLFYIPLSNQVRFDIFWLKLLGAVLLIFGFVIALKSRMEFVRREQRVHHVTQKLITTGWYKTMRHPQYFGLMLCYIGLSLLLGSLYAIILFPGVIVLHVLQAWMEEKFVLEKLFKKEYKAYKKKVGMFWRI